MGYAPTGCIAHGPKLIEYLECKPQDSDVLMSVHLWPFKSMPFWWAMGTGGAVLMWEGKVQRKSPCSPHTIVFGKPKITLKRVSYAFGRGWEEWHFLTLAFWSFLFGVTSGRAPGPFLRILRVPCTRETKADPQHAKYAHPSFELSSWTPSIFKWG